MAVLTSDIEKWIDSGWQMATRYYPKLDGLDDNYQGDFDYIYYFADSDSVKPVNIGFAIGRLKKKARSVTDLKAKNELNDFIASSSVLFVPTGKEKGADKVAEVRQWLLDKGRAPSEEAAIREYQKLYGATAGSQEAQPRPSGSFWKRLDRTISNIGLWIESIIDVAPDVAVVVIGVVALVAAAVAVIGSWIVNGFWSAVLAAVVCGVLLYIGMYAAGLFMLLARGVLYVLRGIFYNAVTFLLTLALVLYVVISSVI